jgi:ubiquinone biosynthesis protein
MAFLKTLSPADLRRLLERLGPTFIKLGQHLALRPDLIPQEYCDELLRLTDQATPFPWSEARSTLAASLGQDPSNVFRRIERTPAGAGSLAQVHKAVLKDGTEVAVKIRRTDVAARVERDLSRARLLVRILKVARVSSVVSPTDLVDELASWLQQELDFRNEFRNCQQLYNLSADSSVARIPYPYPELSGDNVLVLEYLAGTPLTRVIAALSDDEHPAPSDLQGFDARVFAMNLVETSLRQIFVYQFFHADVHPGNLLTRGDNSIGFVDFGLCERIDPGVREAQGRYLAAVYMGDTEQIFRALLRILTITDQSNVEGFRRDYLKETRNLGFADSYWQESDSRQGPSPLAQYLVALVRSARTNRLQLPRRVLLMYRTLLTVENVVARLGHPDVVRIVGARFFQTLQITDAIGRLTPESLAPTLLAQLNLLHDGPRQVSQLLADLADGSYQLPVRVTESRRVERSRARRTRILALSLVSIGVALLLQSPLPGGRYAHYAVFAILCGIYLTLIVLLRRVL